MVIGKKTFRYEWILLAFLVVVSTSILGYGDKNVEIGKNTHAALNESFAQGPVVDADIQKAVENLETITALMEELRHNGVPDRDTVNSMLKAILRKNPHYLATWTCWEPNALDNLDYQHINNVGHDETGRFIPYWNRLNGQIDVAPLANYNAQGKGDYYRVPFKSGKITIFDPVEYTVKGTRLNKIVVAAPIHLDNQVAGVVGIDITVENLAEPPDKQI